MTCASLCQEHSLPHCFKRPHRFSKCGPWPAAAALPGNLLELHNWGSSLQLMSDTLGLSIRNLFHKPHFKNHCTAAMVLRPFCTLDSSGKFENGWLLRATIQNNAIMISRGGPRNWLFKISPGDSYHLLSWVSTACLGLPWHLVLLFCNSDEHKKSALCHQDLLHHGTTGW